jgi:hypothetical protein
MKIILPIVISLLLLIFSCGVDEKNNSSDVLTKEESTIKKPISYDDISNNINNTNIKNLLFKEDSISFSKTRFNKFEKENYIIEGEGEDGNKYKFFYNENIFIINPFKDKKLIKTGELISTDFDSKTIVTVYDQKGVEKTSFITESNDFYFSNDSIIYMIKGAKMKMAFDTPPLNKSHNSLRETTINDLLSKSKMEIINIDTLYSMYYEDYKKVDIDYSAHENYQSNYIFSITNDKSINEGLIIGYSQTNIWDYEFVSTTFNLNYYSALEDRWLEINEFSTNYYRIDNNNLLKTKIGCCGNPTYIELSNIINGETLFVSNINDFKKISSNSNENITVGYIGITDFETNYFYELDSNNTRSSIDSIYIANNQEVLFRNSFNYEKDNFLIIHEKDTIYLKDIQEKQISLENNFEILHMRKDSVLVTKKISLSNE